MTEAQGNAEKLRLEAIGGDGELFWFVNGELFARSPQGRPLFWQLRRGHHTIVCADASGRFDEARIVVE